MDVRTAISTVIARLGLRLFAFTLVALTAPWSLAYAQGERVFESKLPQDLPFKINIKRGREASFRDLQNEKWLRELELELTNTGRKPIYNLRITLRTDLVVHGSRLLVPLTYGRAELGDVARKATLDDVPVHPGETIIIRLPSDRIRSLERWDDAARIVQVTKVHVVLYSASLGDGTGYIRNQPYPSSSRVFENEVSENVPIKIRIKKEESFKDLKNDSWVREFELELTNTGNKPIYFLLLHLVTDVSAGGQPFVFPIVYGRAELGGIISKARLDDIPIKPGETHIFKINLGSIEAWEKSVREQRHQQATWLFAEPQMLSFGDGNGYFVNEPYPSADKRQSGPVLSEQLHKR
jgi:hypothetical protein